MEVTDIKKTNYKGFLLILVLFIVITLTYLIKESAKPDVKRVVINNLVASFDIESGIKVITREEGSGLRYEFCRNFGLNISEDSIRDFIYRDAFVANDNEQILRNISSNPSYIGYISLAQVDDRVKVLNVDNMSPSIENVANGSYKITRPIYITSQFVPTGVTEDFINFIKSKEGQEIISQKYVCFNEDSQSFKGMKVGGIIYISGSSDMKPLMEDLVDKYLEYNPMAKVKINESNSTAGLLSVKDGSCDIGMSSRSLTSKERKDLIEQRIAYDAVAIVVSKANKFENLSSDQIAKIYKGDYKTWSDLE